MSEKRPASERIRVRQAPDRGSYDRESVASVLDAGLIGHVGFVADGQPFVIPMVYGRIGEHVYLHASAASRIVRCLRQGGPVCLTVTILDGLVLARSLFHHSMNYRSVVVLGCPAEVTDEKEKLAALEAIAEHLVPGRVSEARGPNERELEVTSVLRLSLEEASVKARTGPPGDEEEDYALDVWAGVIPLQRSTLPPQADARMPQGRLLPESVRRFPDAPEAGPRL
jgi:nitroimidazol reductase NimA-like FMN-containing flavoprotein (pyridoxamine 5'-phosphate oxidase superfamily)